MMLTPWHCCNPYVLEVGVKFTGTKRTPEISRAFKYFASSAALIQGAPNNSNGESVPRPTETFVPSTSDTPGYSVASVKLRRFGDGLIHASPVESYQSPRIHPSSGTTWRRALMPRSLLNNFASSPMVIPWRTGTKP